MLGKLFITSRSTLEKLQSTNELVLKAIDDKVASDAASRTALNKIHNALSKALGEAGNCPNKAADDTVLPVADDGVTVMEEQDESLAADDEEIKLEPGAEEGLAEGRDSILEELLDDEDDTL